MKTSQAFIPTYLSEKQNRVLANGLSLIGGVSLISVLAQLWIPLPFTPVPITGQTFGVALVSLLWGRSRGVATVSTYFLLGASGLPIFAKGASGFVLGPTTGYLVGMLVASYFIGGLADRGWTKSKLKAFFAAYMGSFFVFLFGVIGLSFFLPKDQLFVSGVLPFLPGDLIKTFLASSIAYQTQKHYEV